MTQPAIALAPRSSTTSQSPLLRAEHLRKSFTLHMQGGVSIPVLEDVSLKLFAGDCVALVGPSGSGKTTFMRCLYANYRADRGAVKVIHEGGEVDLTQLAPHDLIVVRQKTVGYVSQFLRVIPRVPAIDVVAEPLLELGEDEIVARHKAKDLLARLNLPENLWRLSPTTFSGGEKQRVNIARAFVVDYPVLLLDEPTSALDAANREVVMELIEERKARGCGAIGIFHDREVRDRVCNRELHFGSQAELSQAIA
ncbi:MAG: phosphonate C-P lyase system protein PhnL [Cyanobacteria bacterium J06648_11]